MTFMFFLLMVDFFVEVEFFKCINTEFKNTEPL